MSEMKFANLPVAEIRQGVNVRLDLRDIDALTASVRARGVRSPITVVPDESGTGAEVLIGFRRLEAAKRAGLKTIPCMLRPRARSMERVADQLTENLQRSDMTVLELALAYRELLDGGMTCAQIGKIVGYTETWVKRTLRLLDMPECVQRAAHEGVIAATRATDIPLHMFDAEGAVDRLALALTERGREGLAEWFHDEHERQRDAARERACLADAGSDNGLAAVSEPLNKATANRLAPGTWRLTVLCGIELRAPILKAARDAGRTPGEYVEEMLRAAVGLD